MTEIIPRWEWRTFADDLGEAEAAIRQHPEGPTRESDEIYILSEAGIDNTKIRADLMDVKTLREVNADRLELWMPTMKAAFPIGHDSIREVFACFRVTVPELERESYTLDEYLSELIEPCLLLRAVRVHKRRTGFSIDGCTVEIAEVVADGKAGRTAAVEMEDPARVIATVRALGLDRFPNINYLRGLKGLVGMD
jgi:exopolyphosphatase/guanosine-5'-triphosphate,3'-diphosphate pyrophosphatase